MTCSMEFLGNANRRFKRTENRLYEPLTILNWKTEVVFFPVNELSLSKQ